MNWGLRQGFRVYGDSYVAINFYSRDQNIGVISKYTEIDIDGEWFDVEDFDVATPKSIEEIQIPDHLRPNLSQFWFSMDEDVHVFTFSSYSESRSLSARSMERYFKLALESRQIKDRFGAVEADVIQSFEEVDRLLDLPDLRELHLSIRRPNSDDVPGDLARIIEERLREQNAEEFEESTTTKDREGLKPNDRTRKLAYVAAENGSVRAKSLVNGIMTPASTENQPLVEKDTIPTDDGDRPHFQRLSKAILEKIRNMRRTYSDGE